MQIGLVDVYANHGILIVGADRELGVAERAAKKGSSGKGVVIEARIPKGQPHIHVNDEPWADPDLRFEFEILVEGPLRGEPRKVGW